MFHNLEGIQQEVQARQARFQAQAAQARLVNAGAVARQTGEISGCREMKRPWFLALGLRLVKQAK
jgi:hypothetical protein